MTVTEKEQHLLNLSMPAKHITPDTPVVLLSVAQSVVRMPTQADTALTDLQASDVPSQEQDTLRRPTHQKEK